MTKPYENESYNAAFIRCIDVMARLIQTYGSQVLESQCPAIIEEQTTMAVGTSGSVQKIAA